MRLVAKKIENLLEIYLYLLYNVLVKTVRRSFLSGKTKNYTWRIKREKKNFVIIVDYDYVHVCFYRL